MTHSSLWGVLYLEKKEPAMERVYSYLQRLSLVTEQQLLLVPDLTPYLALPVNLLVPRQPQAGSLGIWLDVWQDTPASAMLWLDGGAPLPTEQVCRTLAQARGKLKFLSGPLGAAFYDRACQGAGLRLWRNGETDYQVLLKVFGKRKLPT
ncbi:MAG: hypothetical protein LBJ14_03970 [Desulfarculales bacterium]|jgi:hypothetical protein|nr:hypothetical protein [Desulfarculales bacterium]